MKNISMSLMAVPATLLLTMACANPAKDATPAQVNEPAAAAAEPVAEAAPVTGERLVIASDSKVEWVGSKVTGSHDGGFEKVSGTITLVNGTPEGSIVDVAIDATSLWSDNENLTGHLKSADFFDVATYPEARFTSTAIAAAPEGGYSITGDLTLHGVTKSITFPATITVAESEVTANAEFSIKRFDWNIVYAGKADDLIRDDVLIKLAIVARPEAADPAAADTTDEAPVDAAEG